MYIDSFFYGKTVIAPLGIVLYNVFGKGGPNLYGEAQTTLSYMYIFKKGPQVMFTNYHESIYKL